jgi:hypothetical protein
MRKYFLHSTEPNYSVFRRHISVPSILQNWAQLAFMVLAKGPDLKCEQRDNLDAAPAPVTDLMKKSLQKFQTGESTSYFVNMNTKISMYLYSLM